MAEVTAMRNNVLAYPVYGLPYVVTFPILDADGDLVTGAAGLDSEVSKNGDTFADCTNEATEVATSSGIYYLSLTATEMTTDVVTIIVKTTSTGAKTTTLTLYPVKLPSLLTGTAAAGAAGSITLENVAASLAVDDYFNGCLIFTTGGTGSGQVRRISDYVGSTRVASVKPDWATTPDSTTTYEIYLTDTAVNALKANISAISDDATAADNAEAFFDGTGYAGTNNVIPTVTSVTNRVTADTTYIAGSAVSTSTAQIGVNVIQAAGTAWGSGAITAASIATNAIGAAELAADAVTEIVTGVWNAATASYGGAGTYGQAIEDAIADTNELQAEFVDGGRLDLLIDAIKAKTDSLNFTGTDVKATLDGETVTVGTNNDKTGYTASTVSDKTGYSLTADQSGVTIGTVNALASGAIASIWNALTSGMSTAGSIGKRIVDYLTGDIFARLGAPAGASVSADIAAVNAKTTNLPSDPADQSAVEAAITAAHSTTNGKIDAVDDYVDTEVSAIKAVTDKIDTAVELDGAVYRFTTNALEQAPSGGTPPTAAAIADAVWDEALSGHADAGSAGASLSAAGVAGDPWATAIPGAYGAGTAGKILGDNINAPIATVDTVVDAIKAKTDSLTFTVAGDVDVNVQSWKGSAAPDMTGDAYAVVNHAEYGNLANAMALSSITEEVAKVPKSDSTVTWNATALGSIQAECTDALNAYDPPTKAEMDSAFATTDGKIDVIDGIVDDILVDTGTTLPGTLSTLSTAVSGVAAAVWNYLTAAMTTVDSIGKALADWLPGTAAGAPPYTASVVAICNNALLMLGNNAITALTDDTKAAKLCAQFYQLALDSVLRAYTWNCATVRSAALAATTTPTFGFSYAFTLPDDCLRVLTIEDDQAIPFKVENGVLLTDESTCKISYLKRIAPDDADSLLLEAISARLAATIAFPLTNSTSAAEAMWKLYEKKLDEAQSVDAFEGTAPQMASDDWINSRS